MHKKASNYHLSISVFYHKLFKSSHSKYCNDIQKKKKKKKKNTLNYI